MHKHNTGFTIVELLIVIVVIAVLAAITTVSYSAVRYKALDASLKSDAANGARLLSIEQSLNGSYPTSASSVNGGKGLPSSSGNTFTYTPEATASPSSYTLTYANSAFSGGSYQVTNLNSTPTLITGSAPVVTYPLSNGQFETGGCGAEYYNFGLYATATGSPTPTIQWQRMTPKNTTTGTWSNITGGTTNYYVYYDNTLIEGDYRLFRAIFTSGSYTATSPTLQLTLTNGC